ncbi:MAG: polyhydroxyalkanoate depolymerase [Myxococcales bacterium]|nr:MAG: polyhydroxyalkanoate depolymerase [Myxococcales bacterium]
MLYHLHEFQRAWLDPFAHLAGAVAQQLRDPHNPVGRLPGARTVAANQALFHRLARRYGKPSFGLDEVEAHGARVRVSEQVVAATPFCRLVRFARATDDPELAAVLARDVRVMVTAPLSGHHASLVRDTIKSLLHDHDVYVTDWVDAREVPLRDGSFSLDDYVTTVQRFIRTLGAGDLHVLAVCQPTVPVLAAIALLAQAGEATPRTMTLMGGPVDARISPTAVNRLATERSYAWFERNMTYTVPGIYPGAGRKVYPGFLQLTAFVSMNPDRHLSSYRDYWRDVRRGAEGSAGCEAHERFYDEYNAVLDMDAAYYLETVRVVFQDFALARGAWDVHGVRVRPAAITATALATIEGEQDDISGPGQTEAAQTLCSSLRPDQRMHHVAPGCGHYGVFSGSKWRTSIYPRVRDFIREHSAAQLTG